MDQPTYVQIYNQLLKAVIENNSKNQKVTIKPQDFARSLLEQSNIIQEQIATLQTQFQNIKNSCSQKNCDYDFVNNTIASIQNDYSQFRATNAELQRQILERYQVVLNAERTLLNSGELFQSSQLKSTNDLKSTLESIRAEIKQFFFDFMKVYDDQKSQTKEMIKEYSNNISEKIHQIDQDMREHDYNFDQTQHNINAQRQFNEVTKAKLYTVENRLNEQQNQTKNLETVLRDNAILFDSKFQDIANTIGQLQAKHEQDLLNLQNMFDTKIRNNQLDVIHMADVYNIAASNITRLQNDVLAISEKLVGQAEEFQGKVVLLNTNDDAIKQEQSIQKQQLDDASNKLRQLKSLKFSFQKLMQRVQKYLPEIDETKSKAEQKSEVKKNLVDTQIIKKRQNNEIDQSEETKEETHVTEHSEHPKPKRNNYMDDMGGQGKQQNKDSANSDVFLYSLLFLASSAIGFYVYKKYQTHKKGKKQQLALKNQ